MTNIYNADNMNYETKIHYTYTIMFYDAYGIIIAKNLDETQGFKVTLTINRHHKHDVKIELLDNQFWYHVLLDLFIDKLDSDSAYVTRIKKMSCYLN